MNRGLVASFLWLALASAHAGPAQAGNAAPTAAEREEAKRAYAEARRLTKENKPVEALELYRRAHDLAPTPVTRIELARALAAVGKLLEARSLAGEVASMPVTATETRKSKEARVEAASFVGDLTERIPQVTIAVTAPAGTEPEVAIDGNPLSKSLLTAPLPLDPGRHEIVARANGKEIASTFEVLERDRRTIPLVVPAAEAPPPPPVPTSTNVAPPPPVPQPPRATTHDDGITPFVPVLLTVGGVGLATGAITGAIALSQAGELIDGCPGGACPPALHSELSTHFGLTTTSTITFLVGGAATAAGVIVWVVDATSHDAPAVQARFTGTGVALEGAW